MCSVLAGEASCNLRQFFVVHSYLHDFSKLTTVPYHFENSNHPHKSTHLKGCCLLLTEPHLVNTDPRHALKLEF